MIAFAKEFDPQFYHLDEVAALMQQRMADSAPGAGQ